MKTRQETLEAYDYAIDRIKEASNGDGWPVQDAALNAYFMLKEHGDKIRKALTENTWRDVSEALHDGTPYLLAAYIIPSEEAAKHGSKPYWDFGIGRPINPKRNGSHWTGIVGGNPSHFKHLEPPKPEQPPC